MRKLRLGKVKGRPQSRSDCLSNQDSNPSPGTVDLGLPRITSPGSDGKPGLLPQTTGHRPLLVARDAPVLTWLISADLHLGPPSLGSSCCAGVTAGHADVGVATRAHVAVALEPSPAPRGGRACPCPRCAALLPSAASHHLVEGRRGHSPAGRVCRCVTALLVPGRSPGVGSRGCTPCSAGRGRHGGEGTGLTCGGLT